MKKYLIIISMMLFLVPGFVYATIWGVGDSLTVYSPNPSVDSKVTGSGGLFTITNTTRNETIKTFCVELDEYMSTSMKVWDAADDIVWGGGRETNSGDPLSGSTKWLYSEYLKGIISGNENLQAMQLAIWYLEDEYFDKGGNPPTPEQWRDWYDLNGGYLVTQAYVYIKVALTQSSYTNDQILALDTYDSTIDYGQSFIYNVPEPGILILLGIALSAVGLASRRFKF